MDEILYSPNSDFNHIIRFGLRNQAPDHGSRVASTMVGRSSSV